ncbi:aldehyde dehydrogenase family protein [Nocardiopsis sp. ARC36]
MVLADADLDLAVPAAVRARFTNAGQSCVCAKRFIVERTAYEEFVRRFVAAAASLRVGDPTDPATQMGPLAREDLRHALHDQVERSVAAGAELRTGGGPLDRDGYFYAPTVLTNTGPGVPAFDEETFGPVAAVAVAEDEDHAVELANATVYGLGASVWTADAERGAAVARRLRSGAVFVNAVVASDPGSRSAVWAGAATGASWVWPASGSSPTPAPTGAPPDRVRRGGVVEHGRAPPPRPGTAPRIPHRPPTQIG